MSVRCLIVQVRGRVQGVGFRFACQREAERLGIRGWVRNRQDGSVECCITGDDEAVADMRAWLREGPPFAEVVQVVAEEAPAHEELPGFSVRPDK